MTHKLKAGTAIAAVLAVIGLSGCVSDGSYSSFSMGVSSYDGPRDYHGGYGYRAPYRSYGDADGDGVPNWADRRPHNPWID